MDDSTGPADGHEDPSDGSHGDQDESGEQKDATGPRSAHVSRRESSGEAGGLRRPAADGEPVSRDDTPPFGRRRRGRFAVGGVAVLVVGALVAALFVLPVQGVVRVSAVPSPRPTSSST